MQRTLKKFRILFFSIFAAIFISAIVLCIFKFKVFADSVKKCFEVYISGAVYKNEYTLDSGELPADWSPDDYPVIRYDGKEHNCYVYPYNLNKDFLKELLGDDGNATVCHLRFMGVEKRYDVYKTINTNNCLHPAVNFTCTEPGYYRFEASMGRDENHWFDLPDGYHMPDGFGGICISDIQSNGEDVAYSGSAHHITVNPGAMEHVVTDKNNSPVNFSTIDPRSVADPENDINWSPNNPEYTDVGTHIVYYRVHTKLPFYDVKGKGDDKERIFYGSETIKINPKQNQGEYRKSIFESATGINAPKKDPSYGNLVDNIYLGSFANGSYSQGIKFKFLSASANDDFYKGGYLLMSDNVLGKTAVDTDPDIDKMFYSNDCTLSQYMNNYNSSDNSYTDIYHNAFTDLEKSNILKFNSKTDEDKILTGIPGLTQSVVRALGSYFKGNENSYLFPLSGVEAHNKDYGFTENLSGDNNRGYTNNEVSDYWWCRSVYRSENYQLSGSTKGLAVSTSFQCGAFPNTGYFSPGDFHTSLYGIRPSLNFDASKVILTSVAGDPEKGTKGAKALPTTENFIKSEDEQYQSLDFKFTLDDTKSDANPKGLDFQFNTTEKFKDSTGEKTWDQVQGEGLVSTTENRVIKIPYKGVTTGIDSTYISALIVNAGKDKGNTKAGSVEYYGRPDVVSQEEGTLEITLPLDLEKGEYSLKLFEEKYNGGNYDNNNLTDYGSKPVAVKLIMKQNIDYDHSNFEIYRHVWYDENLHGFGDDKEFRIIPQEPLKPSDVKITYANVTDNPDDPNPQFSENPITEIDPHVVNGEVKPYIFKFKMSIKNDNSTYYSEKIETVYLTIDKRTIKYAAPEKLDVLYDGTEKSISVSVSEPSSTHTQYSEDGVNYRDQNFYYKSAGEHKVYFKITDFGGRYADTVGSEILNIRPKPIQYYSTSVETPYDGQEHDIKVNISGDPSKDIATIKYYNEKTGKYDLDTCPAYINTGNYTIKFKITTTDGNYQEAQGETTLKIDKGTIFYTVGDLQADYNGGYHQIDMRFNNVPDAAKPTVTYFKDAAHTEIYEGAPYFKDATDGKQNVYYHIDAGPVPGKTNEYNYESVDGVTTVDIRPATIQYKVEDISTLTYDGDKHGAVISTTNVDDSGSTITYSEDGVNYGLVNPRYADAGTYTVYYKIDADNFKEAKGQVTFTIQQRPMSYVYIEDIPGRIFNGAPITPSVIVHDGDPSIVRDDDYDVSYTDNTAPGMGIVTLIGKHNYTGSTTKHFMIYSDSDTNGASEAYTFDTSGSSLLGLPSFGTSHKSNSSNVGAPTDANNQDIDQTPADNNNGANQDNKVNDPNSNNTPKPKSFRDYIYIIIGGSILLLSILAVLILKIRSHRVKAKPIDVENIEVPEPTNDAK